jgi:hypothetical protein
MWTDAGIRRFRTTELRFKSAQAMSDVTDEDAPHEILEMDQLSASLTCIGNSSRCSKKESHGRLEEIG